MDFDFIRSATSKELEQFKSVCNQLLSRTYIVRTLFRPGKGRVNNPDYTFLSLHYEAVQEYLSLLDWDLRKDDLNGYFYVINTDEANRCNLNKKETAILLALRMIYEENQEQLGLEQDAVCTVRDVLEKVVTDYAILPAKPNMDEVKRALTLLENHSIIQRIEGKFNQSGCKFAILPTVLAAVSSEKLNSIKGTLSINHTYDYLIVDEASQVDLATGVLAFSCARNIVIVGDLKQLPNVLTEDDIRTSDSIWQKYSLDERYRFSTHSLLSSALEIWQDAPVTLLREHYRCHPKIINFCNQKFYHGQLIVMTKDHDEPDVLTMYRTTAGNHARGHLNQRQIDVIQQEALPRLHQQNFESIGIITPYRDQVAAIRKQLGDPLRHGSSET